ncbi:MAG: hypothetical protein SVM79_00070 [Chloroflexota bacterium]|nr:hypothetical protein [Chloroflexota bacterium]
MLIPLNIPFFDASEFPTNEVKYTDPHLFIALSKQRQIFDDFLNGCTIRPSRAAGALARLDGLETSQHFAKKNMSRLSCACDWFPGRGPSILQVFNLVVSSGLWGGVGVYFNKFSNSAWSKDIMLHTDLRPKDKYPFTFIWFDDKEGIRHYPQFSPIEMIAFNRLLMEADYD